MKKIVINSDNRRFNISSIVVGYLEENKEEVLEFEIPEKYAEYGKKACFSANGQTFAKNFDNITSNKLTITRDISQFKELDMTIEFFKIENEDEIVARTSILHILIENAIICDDDIKPDEPKIIILDNLIDEVTKLDVLVTKNEEKREKYYQEIQKKVDNGDFNGATFTPSVDAEGNISWSNNKNLSNPTTQNIKGPKGPKGDTYNLTEQDKQDISSMTVESSESAFNQYYNGKLEDFNSNATSKTNDYNTNATNKTTEYNNNATSKVNEYNTNADNKIAEYDLHSQELNNKIIDTRNELERVKNDVLETGTDTDTYIHLEDSAMAEYQELSVDGVCEQKTTSGKNLCNLNVVQDSRVVYNSDGTITINGAGGFSLKISDYTFKANTTYYMKWELVSGSVNQEQIFMTPDSKIFVKKDTFIQFKFDSDTVVRGLWIHGGALFTNAIIRIWFSETQSPFEPYTGGQPSPSPNYPQEIKTIENSLKITSNNGELEDSENYLFSQIQANLPEGEFIGKINDTYKDTLKVEYNEDDGQYHLNLYKNIGKVVLDGSEYYTLLGNTSDYYEFQTSLTPNAITGYAFPISTHFSNRTNNRIVSNGTNILIIVPISANITTPDEFKTWLSENNVTIYYILATPYVVDLGIVDMPITYNEITNLFTDSDLLPTINAKYYRNFITTIQNLQVNEKALKQELIDINTRLSALETAQTSVVSESEVVE